MPEQRTIRGWIYLCFFLSGISGLIYEIVWMRKLALVFGNTVHAVSTVLAVFMGGLALGSYFFGRTADRSERPLSLYVVLELVIALAGILVMFLFIPVLDRIYLFFFKLGLHSGAGVVFMRFVLASAILIVPTFCMGGTLPVLGRFLVRATGEVGSRMGALYGVNTLGAVAGCFATGFWLIGTFGELTTVLVAVSGNLLAAAGAFLVSRYTGKGHSPARKASKREALPEQKIPSGPVIAMVPWLYGAAGFAALAYEVLWTRALVYFIGNSTYAFTTILTCFLVGIGAGSLAMSRLTDRLKHPFTAFGILQWVITVFALASILAMGALPHIDQKVKLIFEATGWSQITGTMFLLCMVVLGVPTLAMGATFPLVNRLYIQQREAVGKRVGRLYAFNTLGTIGGSLFAGFVFLPLLGIAGSLALTAGINALVATAAFSLAQKPRLIKGILGTACLASLGAGTWIVAATGNFGPVVSHKLMAVGKELLFCKETTEASISVLRNSQGERELNLNGQSTAYTGLEDMIIHKLLAHLPVLFHPDPKNILVVGFGFGSTAYTCMVHDLPSVECVEIVPDEVTTAGYFLPENHGVLEDPRLRMIFDDGRSLILTSSKKYDMISFNAIHPRLSPMLYTLDFYLLCRKALKPGGTICAWLPTNALTLKEYKVLLRTFITVFPHSSLWICNPANTILLGTSGPLRIDYPSWRSRVLREKVQRDLREVNLDQPLGIATCFIMGEDRLRKLTEDVPLNTDANPIVEFSRCDYNLQKVPSETFAWLTKNMEPVANYLRWPEDEGVADSLAALRALSLKWYQSRRIFYFGKFASWTYSEHGAARELYRKALKLNPDDEYIQYFLRGSGLDADSLAGVAEAVPGDFIVRQQLASLYMDQVNWPKAEHWLNEVLRIKPDYAQAWFNLGICSDFQGNLSAAENYFLKALDLEPTSPETMINLGLISYRGKDFEKAEQYFQKVIRLYPENGAAPFNMGNLRLRQGRSQEAESYYRETLRNDPFKAEAYLNLGVMLTQRGKYQEAITNFQTVLELSPYLSTAYRNLALTYEKMGDQAQAEKYRAMYEQLSGPSNQPADGKK